MAARRIFSLLAPRISQTTLIKATQDLHPSSKPLSHIYENYTRRFQTLAETSIENLVKRESLISNPNSGTTEKLSDSMNTETTVTHRVNSDLKVSARHDLAMIFTCKVCETRSIKTVCRESYEKGVVVVRCDGCNNLHLIADRLGWFGEPGSVEEFLAAKGEEVNKGSVDTLNLTLEDLTGMKNLET